MTEMILQDSRLIEIFPGSILILNQKGQIVSWNNAARAQLKLTREFHKYLNIQQLIRVNTNFPWPLQQEIPAVLQHNVHTKLTITLLFYNEDYYILLVRDATHLQYLEQMRQDFVANVSHELRSPLTVIHGYLEVLLAQERNTSVNKPILQQMLLQSSRMNELIADLLLLSRLEADDHLEGSKTSINISALLLKIKEEAIALSGIRQHQFKLIVDPDLNLMGAEDELHSAFNNLVFNAINYTPASGEIEIIWTRKNNNKLLIVADKGIGIAKKHIPRLTERFYRVDKARSRKSGGTGLGLSIVKHVLLRHGGYLEIASQLGKGSVFTCVFPEASS